MHAYRLFALIVPFTLGACAVGTGDSESTPESALTDPETGAVESVGEASQALCINSSNNLLKAISSNLCVEVLGASFVPGSIVDQWACNGFPNQRWRIVPASNGYYNLINVNSNMCLDVLGGSAVDGTPVDEWPCTGGFNQQFWLSDAGVPGTCTTKLIARHSSLCLTVAGNSQIPGTPMVQSTCNGATYQQFRFLQ